MQESDEDILTVGTETIFIIKTYLSLPPFAKGRIFPSLVKRGKGRFSGKYLFNI